MSTAINILSTLVLVLLFLVLITAFVFYVIDTRQAKNTIRKNYPVIGRFRTLFEHLGEFFRQYFFAMDREEMPFNRAQRNWISRATKGSKNTVAFGSTRNISLPGSVLFENTQFPKLEAQHTAPKMVSVGEGYCTQPYHTASVFNISGMSFGALSKPAVMALSKGAKKAGVWLNTGEGGLAPYHLVGNCDVIFQIGTAKYGVRTLDGKLDPKKLEEVGKIPQVKMIEIKLSQGAKPGKGGILPAVKVTEEIAAIRGIPAGEASISPNRHPEVNSTEDLLRFVKMVRETTGKPVGLKGVLGGNLWATELCETIQRMGLEFAPDFFSLDGGDGGTGAAPMALMDNVGLPLFESLPFLINELIRFDLRDRVKVVASGKLLNPAEIAWALCTGADFIASARGPMFALGCIQALKCNKNTCPTGITTHKESLNKALDVDSKAIAVSNYIKQVNKELNIIAHSVGVTEPRELGRRHARMVLPDGTTTRLTKLYPYPDFSLDR